MTNDDKTRRIDQLNCEIEELTYKQLLRDIPALIRYQREPKHEKFLEAKKYFDEREAQKDALKEKISILKQEKL